MSSCNSKTVSATHSATNLWTHFPFVFNNKKLYENKIEKVCGEAAVTMTNEDLKHKIGNEISKDWAWAWAWPR